MGQGTADPLLATVSWYHDLYDRWVGCPTHSPGRICVLFLKAYSVAVIPPEQDSSDQDKCQWPDPGCAIEDQLQQSKTTLTG